MTDTRPPVSSDEQFYQQLMALREEQMETMKQLESLYAAKMELQGDEVEVSGTAENLEQLAAQNMRISDSRLAQFEREYQELTLEDFRNEEMFESNEQEENQTAEDITADQMWDGVTITDYMRKLDLEHAKHLQDIEATLMKHRVDAVVKAKKPIKSASEEN